MLPFGALGVTGVATLSLEPLNQTHQTRDFAAVTATFTNSDGAIESNMPIQFVVTGPNNVESQDAKPIDSNGKATFSYQGVFRGADTVTAFTDPNRNKVIDPSEFSTTVQVTWTNSDQPAALTLNVSRSTAIIGMTELLTVTVRDGSADPVKDVTVHLDVDGAHSATVSGSTNADGQVTFDYT
jgi:hypothetical protein